MNPSAKISRITVVDALRGFAVVAIMLLHFIEHFIYGVYPEASSETSTLINQGVWDGLFFIFADKSYTMFAQIWFCQWWLRKHKQGVLEGIWHKLTWLKIK